MGKPIARLVWLTGVQSLLLPTVTGVTDSKYSNFYCQKNETAAGLV